MAEDLTGSVQETNKELDGTITRFEKIKALVGDTASKVKGIAGKGGGEDRIANNGAPGTGGGGGGNPFNTPSPFGGNSPFSYAAPQNNTSFSGNTGAKMMQALGMIGTGAIKTAINVASFLPSTQETVTTSAIAERMRFYSTAGTGGMYSQFGVMNAAMRQGTSMGPTDIIQAINAGATYGLNTGLKNFNAGTGFAGILGGAALASNLAPGIGLTGGMGVMAGLNSPAYVNMLRMLGINVRGQNGTTMNDLPQIIDQLYALITRNNPNPTPSDIATSLMPGNALDSLISQYFGNDPNTRTVIVSGLIQRIKTKTSLRESGTIAQLTKTGGTTLPIASSSMRNLSELQLIQGYTKTTNEALVGTNNVIQALYRGLGGLGVSEGTAGNTLRGVQQLSTSLTTFGGARGGAGAMLLSNLLEGGTVGAGVLKKLVGSTGGKLTLAAGGLAALFGAKELMNSEGFTNSFNQNAVNPVSNLSSIPNAPGSAQSTVGNQFTGAITINVSVPPGADPYAYKSAIADVFS